MWFFKKKDYLEGYDFEVGQIVKKNCFAAQGTIIRLNANNQKSVQVLWTKEAMGAEQVAAIEQSITNQIEQEINPTSVTMTIAD